VAPFDDPSAIKKGVLGRRLQRLLHTDLSNHQVIHTLKDSSLKVQPRPQRCDRHPWVAEVQPGHKGPNDGENHVDAKVVRPVAVLVAVILPPPLPFFRPAELLPVLPRHLNPLAPSLYRMPSAHCRDTALIRALLTPRFLADSRALL